MSWPDWMFDSTALDLLAAAKANPLDETPRLVLADKIQELGDEAVANAMRDSMCGNCRGKEVWFDDVTSARLAPWDGCVNGWLARFEGTEMPVSPWLCALVPTDQMGNVTGDSIAYSIAEDPRFASLVYLDMSAYPIEIFEGAIVALANPEHGMKLHVLIVPSSVVRDVAATAIANSPAMEQLIVLDLRNCDIGDRGASAIAKSKYLSDLRWLSLSSNGVGTKGARAIARSSTLANVQGLFIGANQIGEAGAVAIATSKTLTNLTHLDMSKTELSDDAVRKIANSTTLKRLTKLSLRYCGIGPQGVVAIANSRILSHLTYLDLSDNNVGPGAIALAGSQTLTRLETLILENTQLEDAEIRAVVTSPTFAKVQRLYLAFNYFSEKTALLLAKDPVLKDLECLDLCNCGISLAAIEAILKSKKLSKLQDFCVLSSDLDLDDARCRTILRRFSGKLSIDQQTRALHRYANG